MIHCPDCSTGILKILKPVQESGFIHYRNSEDKLVHSGEIKPDEVLVYCEICKHSHIMKRRNFINPNNKYKVQKIKGYGKYHY